MECLNLILRPEVEITVFDDGTESNSYLITFYQRNWKISETAYYILMEFKIKTQTLSLEQSILSKYGVQVSEKEIQKVIDFIKNNGLAIGYQNNNTFSYKNKYLWGRITIFPENFVSQITVFSFLYKKKVMIPLLFISSVWIIYILVTHPASYVVEEIQQLSFVNIAICYIIIAIIGLFHEFGHSSALLNCGEKPGRIGAGIYFIMPVFFSDVTRAWKLKKNQRVLVDIGGIYIQLLTMMTFYYINLVVFKSEIVTFAILLSSIEIFSNFNPFIKLDGYWILCDFLGITNIKSAILSLIVNPFNKKKSRKNEKMKKSIKIILYSYLITSIVFFTYFINLMINSIQMAYITFSSDISKIINNPSILEDVSIQKSLNYISTRFSSIIVAIFFLRLLYSLFME